MAKNCFLSPLKKDGFLNIMREKKIFVKLSYAEFSALRQLEKNILSNTEILPRQNNQILLAFFISPIPNSPSDSFAQLESKSFQKQT